jgi:glucose/arabinose dehydrogenase
MAFPASVRLVPLLIVALSLGATACSDDEAVDTPSTPEAEPASPEPSRTKKKDSQPPRFDPGQVELELDPVAEGLEAPLGVTHAGDGSGRLFIVEQTGRVRIIENGEVLEEPFLDVSEAIVAGGEQGLLGLAFHPEYRRNGRVFVNYTDVNGDTVIAEFSTSDDPNVADAGSGRPLLQFDQPFSNHNGGQIAFGPDGFLYIGSGDGGSGGDPEGNGQDTNALLGKLLRIDVDAGGRYGIPEDNPFRNGGGAPEVWAYGLRNPWRFSFDSATDELWIADVGQDAFEEINRVRADVPGLNYGWNVMEGRECFGSDDCDRSQKVIPLSGYAHDLGCSVTGGNVYRGSDFPTLTGGYLFADFCSGTIWGIDSQTQGFTEPVELLSSGIAISSFGVDEQEEMYVTDLDGGRVLRVVTR